MTAAILTEIAAILTEMKKRIESLLQTPSTTAFGRLLDGNTELRQKRKKGIALYMVKMEMGDCKSPLSPVSPLHLLCISFISFISFASPSPSPSK
ncbi:MAG: hypothetical protein IJQ38_04890 [Bacteroidaceae bacterium]|nr:hypothetical protein [Bacteroidaceae bacterium]